MIIRQKHLHRPHKREPQMADLSACFLQPVERFPPTAPKLYSALLARRQTAVPSMFRLVRRGVSARVVLQVDAASFKSLASTRHRLRANTHKSGEIGDAQKENLRLRYA